MAMTAEGDETRPRNMRAGFSTSRVRPKVWGIEFPGPAEVAERIAAASGIRGRRSKPGPFSGYAIALGAPRWSLAAMGVPRSAKTIATLRELELVQALLLLHLQEVDDEVDGQAQGMVG